MTASITGGFLYESTIHLLDMMRWLLGEIVEVECRARASVYSELDDFVMLFTCASGQYCAFSSCAHASWAFPFERVELYGDHAQIVTEEMEKVTYTSGLGQPIVQHDFFQLAYSGQVGLSRGRHTFCGRHPCRHDTARDGRGRL